MRKRMITMAAICAAGLAFADDTDPECAALGLRNSYLTQLFCSQLRELGAGNGPSRSIVQEGNPDQDSPVADWGAIGVIQDAYRADPRKTLELIERIKGAGGLPATDDN